jgi:outer membrane protein TolC
MNPLRFARLWLIFALLGSVHGQQVPGPPPSKPAVDLDAGGPMPRPLLPPPATREPVPDSAGTPGAPEPGLPASEARRIDQRADSVIARETGQVILAAQPAAREKTVPMSLLECIRFALQANLEIAIEELNPVIADANLLTSEGNFDPELRFETTYSENTQPIIVDTFTGFETIAGGQRATQYDVEMDQLLPTGGTFNLGTDSQNSQSAGNQFDDEWRSFGGFSATQPLLGGFGTDVNLGPIRIARKGVAAADSAFQFRVERIITDVATAYYELIFTRDDLVARQKSLQLAEQTLADNQARAEIGVMSPLDVSQASSEVATRREEVLRAERAIRDQENTLKRLITDDLLKWLTRRIYPTTIPDSRYVAPPVLNSIGDALKNRADLREAHDILAQRNIQVVIDKNALLPTLDLAGSLGYAGASRYYVESYEQVFDAVNPSWIVGVNFTMPLGNRQDRGNYDASVAREQQALINVKRIEQDIIVEVDNAAGQASTNAERVKAARAAREYAEQALDAEVQKLNAGTSTSFVVLQLQRDLTDARIRELRAVADLQISLAELIRVQGKTLETYKIEIRRQKRQVPTASLPPIPAAQKAPPAGP